MQLNVQLAAVQLSREEGEDGGDPGREASLAAGNLVHRRETLRFAAFQIQMFINALVLAFYGKHLISNGQCYVPKVTLFHSEGSWEI